jgi:hypothetical protein
MVGGKSSYKSVQLTKMPLHLRGERGVIVPEESKCGGDGLRVLI